MLLSTEGYVRQRTNAQKLRIAFVVPPYVALPPKQYGGTELVAALLVQELVALGHEVHVFASGDSVVPCDLYPLCPVALYDAYPHDSDFQSRVARNLVHRALTHIARMSQKFDIIHSHSSDVLTAKVPNTPLLTTLHNSDPTTHALHRTFRDVPVVACSNVQRAHHPEFDFIDAVHHGIDFSRYALGGGEGGYLAFLGRTAPEKGIIMAINVAKAAGRRLKIAARILPDDYYEQVVLPAIASSGGLVEFVGEIGQDQKSGFLGGASALLFPIESEESFGLVQIEAMACGTPVIGPPLSTVPEIVRNNVSGAVVHHDVNAYVAAIDRVAILDRSAVRSYAQARFSGPRMAERYVDVYHQVMAQHAVRRQVSRVA